MTKLLYMKDFDVESCEAQIISLQTTEENKLDIVLDATCFYPRGGGQDWDLGTIKSQGETSVLEVEEVRLDEHGDVHHIGHIASGDELHVGDTVNCKVEHKRREVNTRLHSAGHVIDMAIDSLGLDWVGTKGQHYPHLSAVEYTGSWNADEGNKLQSEIEKRANQFIKQGFQTRLVFMTVDEMETICRHVPENIPKNKPGRVVMYGDDFGIPCGGTHVKNLRDIGIVHIPKLKQKKGIIRVNYTVEGIN